MPGTPRTWSGAMPSTINTDGIEVAVLVDFVGRVVVHTRVDPGPTVAAIRQVGELMADANNIPPATARDIGRRMLCDVLSTMQDRCRQAGPVGAIPAAEVLLIGMELRNAIEAL